VLLQHFQFGLSKDAGLQLDALSEGSFLLKDPTEGKEILDHIQETTPLIDLHNDVPLGGERIEQPRTIISKIQAFIISTILLKVPLLNNRDLGKEHFMRILPLDLLMVLSS
jgi:hypothetical protein